jgi:bacillithiol system protein YtxJ
VLHICEIAGRRDAALLENISFLTAHRTVLPPAKYGNCAFSIYCRACSFHSQELRLMIWNELINEAQLNDLTEQSWEQPVLIFKHSTRCEISSMAKNRLERSSTPQGIAFYYLDLIRHRELSNQIAERFSVRHESPQVLLIRKGECVYEESHNGIRMDKIAEQSEQTMA